MIHSPSLDELNLKACWLTVGIFDGVHCGHRALLQRLVEGAHQADLPAVVVTFHPHPAVVLGGQQDFKLLSTQAERIALLERLGVDCVITQPFDRAFSSQTADQFMGRLKLSLGLRHLVIGYDTALGRDRHGNAARLEELGHELNFTVETVAPLRQGEDIISSSKIRSLIQQGKVSEAAGMLGDAYTVTGTVVHGDGRGRHINLPTANLAVPAEKLIPSNGIYATWAWLGAERIAGATNIGTNPTFTPQKQTSSIETHLLDFNRSLYGQEVKLEFVSRLREEMKYASVEALLEQIQLDIQQTRLLLK